MLPSPAFSKRFVFGLSLLLLGIVLTASVPIYNFKTSYITQLTPANFENQVSKIRQNTNQVSIVHFYKKSDGKSSTFVDEFDKWTNEFRGVFKIGAVDCEEYSKMCEKQGIDKYPTIRIYPPNPLPIANYQEELQVDKLQKAAAKYLHANVIEITNANLKTFLNENPSVPKVLLFTDKKGVPMVYKGLSVAFEKKLNFGIVRSTDTIVSDSYNVKNFPTILLLKAGQKKHQTYKGKQFKFNDIFEFLNVYSQVFVPGGGSSLDSSATKQWMTQIFPELHSKSGKDICLSLQGTLCVILLTNQTPSKQTKAVFEQLNVKYDVKMDRGTKFKFMWLNTGIEKAWGDVFGYQGEDKVVVLNPGKRKRYTPHEGPLQKEQIGATLDTIMGGDAKFNRVGEVPTFEIRTE